MSCEVSSKSKTDCRRCIVELRLYFAGKPCTRYVLSYSGTFLTGVAVESDVEPVEASSISHSPVEDPTGESCLGFGSYG